MQKDGNLKQERLKLLTQSLVKIVTFNHQNCGKDVANEAKDTMRWTGEYVDTTKAFH